MNRDILNKIQAIISDPNRIDEVSYGELSEWEESLPFYQPLKYLLKLKANKLGIHRQQQTQTTAAYLSQEIEFTHDTDTSTEPIDHELASDDLESIVTDEVTEVLDHTHFGGVQDFDEKELNHKNNEESNLNDITQSMENALVDHNNPSIQDSDEDSAPIENVTSSKENSHLSDTDSTVESDDNSDSLDNSEEEKAEKIATQEIEEDTQVGSSEDDSDHGIEDTDNNGEENHIDDVPSLITTHPTLELEENKEDQYLEESHSNNNVDALNDDQEDSQTEEIAEIDSNRELVEKDKFSDSNNTDIATIEQPKDVESITEEDEPVTHSPILASTGIESIKNQEIPSAFSEDIESDAVDIDENPDDQDISEREQVELPDHDQITMDDSLESEYRENLSEFTLWLKSTKRKKTKASKAKKKKKKKKVADKKVKKKKDKPKKKKKSSKTVIEDANKSNYRDNTIISETLADILASQGHNSEAEKMYNQLSLLFPEKSDYFAAKIKNLKNNS